MATAPSIALILTLALAGCTQPNGPNVGAGSGDSITSSQTLPSSQTSGSPDDGGNGSRTIELANSSRAWGPISNGGWQAAFTTTESMWNMTIRATVRTTDAGVYYLGSGASGSGNAGLNFAPEDDNLSPMGYIPFQNAQGNAAGVTDLEQRQKSIPNPPAAQWALNLFGAGQNVHVEYVVTVETDAA